MNGAGLTPGSVAGFGASGGDRIMGAEAECFSEVIEGGLVTRSWVVESEERIWKPSLRIRLRR